MQYFTSGESLTIPAFIKNGHYLSSFVIMKTIQQPFLQVEVRLPLRCPISFPSTPYLWLISSTNTNLTAVSVWMIHRSTSLLQTCLLSKLNWRNAVFSMHLRLNFQPGKKKSHKLGVLLKIKSICLSEETKSIIFLKYQDL